MPERKVWSGGIGGAIAAVVIGALNAYVFDGAITGEIAAAVTAIIVFVVSYFVPNPEPSE